jgi:hypothetical protein
MAKKKEVSPEFIARTIREMADVGESPEAQLDYLLLRFREAQSAAITATAKMTFLWEFIVSALQELERRGETPEYVASTRRTMGKLIYQPKPLTGETAGFDAARIRREVGRFVGKGEAKKAVTVKRTVTYKVEWTYLASLGPAVVEAVHTIVGLKPPALTVGPVTKRARLGKDRKGR